ncbi:MAG: hypothetical protein HY787_12985 [Deltaproteobacteria bacterium]|nr:hypothetical protein [Deltaproteobacteria bacterium]
MKIIEGAMKKKPAKPGEKRITDELLERYAKHELRASLQKLLEKGERSPYIGPEGGFLWSKLSKTITRSLKVDIPLHEFRRRMPESVEWLARKLVVTNGWGLPIRGPTTSISVPYGELSRQPTVLRAPRSLPASAIQELTDILRDALGDLYGKGHRAKFINNRGKIDWSLLGKLCNLSPQEAAHASYDSCREIIRDIEEYVLSHRQTAERFIKEAHLGLREWEVEV